MTLTLKMFWGSTRREDSCITILGGISPTCMNPEIETTLTVVALIGGVAGGWWIGKLPPPWPWVTYGLSLGGVVVKYSSLIDHWLVIQSVTDTDVCFADPLSGLGSESHADFLKRWRRLGIQLGR